LGNSNSGAQANGTTHDSGTVTITDATAMMIGYSVHSSTGSFTADTDGWTTDKSIAGLITMHKSVSASDALNNTTAGNRTSVTILREIRPTAAGGSVNFFPRRIQVNP